jgi:GT2 family glycosyltransferase
VLAQRDISVRVLIIDDASPDCTAEVATQLSSEDSRVTFVRHPHNKGHIATYNDGIEWASAEYYMILSADDYLLPGALANVGSFMDAHPNVGLAYSRAITLDDSCGTTLPAFVDHTTETQWQVLSGLKFITLSGARNIVPTPTAVVRTRLQKELGGYRPELPHAGDFEMWLRLAAYSAVGVSPAYHAVYRRHASNMSWYYFDRSCLLDIQQRKEAFDCFMDACREILPDAEDTYRRFSRLLACDAVASASGAFSEGEMEVSKQLSALAFRLYPQVKRSAAWSKLTCKRVLGRSAWRALQPAVNSIRQALSPLRRRYADVHWRS